MKKRVNLKIYGRVQGVFYRDSARRKARKLNITGWIRNESDGTVTAMAEGEEQDLKKFIEWCYNGPILAKVEKIESAWERANGEFNKFNIEY